jgi:hypothetical protein
MHLQHATVVGKADPQTGTIVASVVELRSGSSPDVTLFGTAINVIGSSTFALRGEPILVPNTVSPPSGCTVANGQALKVQGVVSGNQLTAQSIACLDSLEGLTVDLTGFASEINPSTNNFKLSGMLTSLTVSHSRATFVNGNSATLTNGQYVVVHGKVVGGVLEAKRVRFAAVPPATHFETEGYAYAVSSTSFKINARQMHYQIGVVSSGALNRGDLVRVRFTLRSDGTGDAVTVTALK